MMKIRRIISIITVLTFFILFSVSPVLAEDTSSSTEEGTGTSAQATDNSTESVSNDVLNVVVPIAEEEPVDIVEGNTGTADAVQPDIGGSESPDSDVLDVLVPITEGEPIDIVDDAAGTGAAVQSEAESTEYLDSAILNVIVPISVSITIDPLELAGKGQVYSNTYIIENNGETDVLLTFTDIQVTFADDINFEALAEPFEGNAGSKLKAIFMMLDFGRDDIPPAVITDPNQKGDISIPLSAGQGDAAGDSLVEFNFSGNVNEASAQYWQDNDVKVSLNYTLKTVIPPVEDVTPAEDATPPVEGTTPPAEDASIPSEEVSAPPEEENVPAGEAIPQSEGEATSNAETEDASGTNSVNAPSGDAPAESPPESDSSESSSPDSSQSTDPSSAPSDTSE